MPRKNTLQIHPKMTSSLIAVGKFPLTARIEAKTEIRSSTGSLTYTWSTVLGLEAIPCSKFDGFSQENRSVPLIEEISFSTIRLAGYYPTIIPTHRCHLSSGEVLDIIGTTTDTKRISTQLTCRLPVPSAEPGV